MEAESNVEQSFYVAVILYKSSLDAPDYAPLYEESFVLIKAASLEQAQEKALAHGRRQEVSYQNETGETITWLLKEVVDVNAILEDKLDDGAELYARHFRNFEAYCQLDPLITGDTI